MDRRCTDTTHPIMKATFIQVFIKLKCRITMFHDLRPFRSASSDNGKIVRIIILSWETETTTSSETSPKWQYCHKAHTLNQNTHYRANEKARLHLPSWTYILGRTFSCHATFDDVTTTPNSASHSTTMTNMARGPPAPEDTSISHSQKSRITHTLTHGIIAFLFQYSVLAQHCTAQPRKNQASRAKWLREVTIDASRRVAPAPLQQNARHRTRISFCM